MRSAAEREVYFKPGLAADSGTRDVTAAEQRKGHSDALVDLVLASREALQLVFSEAFVVRDCAVGLDAERYTRVEIVQYGQASGINVAPGWFEFQSRRCWCCRRTESRNWR